MYLPKEKLTQIKLPTNLLHQSLSHVKKQNTRANFETEKEEE